ncbi:MAG: hypothetical protein L3K26_03555 [Candidatus Hydrogenedentes bacterium]|nr:hypothetical protein [Candidatus Hydrogenedentota bacterium]
MTTDHSLARCPHFGDCGGCKSQDVPYEEQIAAKSTALGELFADFWTDPIPVAPSPDLWHYRNKIDPAFSRMRYPEPPPADFVRETVLGYKKKGQWYWPLDIDECHIGPEGASALFQATRAWYQEKGIRAWDNRSKDGILRYLLVRDGKRSGKKMLVLITHEGELDCVPFVELAQSVYGATSVYRGIFTGRSDVATAERLELLAGDPYITETLHVPDGDGGIRALDFRISPLSFFQTNPMATEHLYGAIRAHVRELEPPSLYDLYGGAGGIAFSCSDLVEKVWSVEEVEPATEDGRYNAEVNGISNVEFITAKTETYLVNQRPDGLAEGATVILDPPRSALHPKAIKRLMEFQPENIIYVSCNPKLLAR